MAYDYLPSAETVLIRCASHRARQHLQRCCPEATASYFSWDTRCTGGFLAIPAARLPVALAIAGCSRASLRFRYHPCLSS